MKNKIIIGLIVLFLSLALLAIALYFYFLSPLKTKVLKEFEVKAGTPTKVILENLEKEELIRNDLVALIHYKLNTYNIKAGTYRLQTDMGTKHILKLFDEGKTIEKEGKKVTFIEGKKLPYFVKKISENFNYTEKDINDVLNSEEFLNKMINKYWFITDEILNKDLYYPLEGYLFPDTYRFNIDASIEEIIETFISTLGKKINDYKDKIEESKYTFHELLALASDVELEGVTLEDRKVIAGVFYNRLNINMSLGSDVTTYYAVKVELHERNLYRNELNSTSPYNTRGANMGGKINIGPICSPSLSSLISVFEPTSSNYLYFYADPSGVIHFSKTLTEHENVVRNFR